MHSGCHCTPRKKRPSLLQTLSMTPSSGKRTRTQCGRDLLDRLVVRGVDLKHILLQDLIQQRSPFNPYPVAGTLVGRSLPVLQRWRLPVPAGPGTGFRRAPHSLPVCPGKCPIPASAAFAVRHFINRNSAASLGADISPHSGQQLFSIAKRVNITPPENKTPSRTRATCAIACSFSKTGRINGAPPAAAIALI